MPLPYCLKVVVENFSEKNGAQSNYLQLISITRAKLAHINRAISLLFSVLTTDRKIHSLLKCSVDSSGVDCHDEQSQKFRFHFVRILFIAKLHPLAVKPKCLEIFMEKMNIKFRFENISVCLSGPPIRVLPYVTVHV